MAGDSYKRVHTGERLQIPAAAWNDLLAMLGDWKATRFSQRGGGPQLSESHVKVCNTTGAVVDRFACLKVNGVTIDPDDNEDGFARQICLDGIEPDAADNVVAVLQRRAVDGEIVPAILSGETIALVNVGSAAHAYAAPASGETVLVSQADAGPWRILWANGTGDDTLCVARWEGGASAGGAPVAAGANDLDQDTITTGDDITASGGIVTWGTVHNYGGTDFWDGVAAPTSGGSTTDRQVITFPAAGRYLVECGITWEANSSGDRHLVLQWGTSLSALVRKAVSQRACASGVTRQGIVATGEVDADETMAVRVMQSSGGDLDLASGILQVTFWPA